jgi:hypothetical protein
MPRLPEQSTAGLTAQDTLHTMFTFVLRTARRAGDGDVHECRAHRQGAGGGLRLGGGGARLSPGELSDGWLHKLTSFALCFCLKLYTSIHCVSAQTKG